MVVEPQMNRPPTALWLVTVWTVAIVLSWCIPAFIVIIAWSQSDAP